MGSALSAVALPGSLCVAMGAVAGNHTVSCRRYNQGCAGCSQGAVQGRLDIIQAAGKGLVSGDIDFRTGSQAGSGGGLGLFRQIQTAVSEADLGGALQGQLTHNIVHAAVHGTAVQGQCCRRDRQGDVVAQALAGAAVNFGVLDHGGAVAQAQVATIGQGITAVDLTVCNIDLTVAGIADVTAAVLIVGIGMAICNDTVINGQAASALRDVAAAGSGAANDRAIFQYSGAASRIDRTTATGGFTAHDAAAQNFHRAGSGLCVDRTAIALGIAVEQQAAVHTEGCAVAQTHKTAVGGLGCIAARCNGAAEKLDQRASCFIILHTKDTAAISAGTATCHFAAAHTIENAQIAVDGEYALFLRGGQGAALQIQHNAVAGDDGQFLGLAVIAVQVVVTGIDLALIGLPGHICQCLATAAGASAGEGSYICGSFGKCFGSIGGYDHHRYQAGNHQKCC